ncbi:MAG: 4-hydroxy-tetrahydrodipicolinate reductase [Caulobacteraceae bacterium]|nr:4-hydroxy-tetrahydrodipicolinate reductase [Caulobacteraceae bacterium]
MDRRIKIAIAGALGRMGRAVAAQIAASDDLAVAGRFDRNPGDGLISMHQALAGADVVIDFTSPASSVALAQAAAADSGPALIIGSTGFKPEELAAIEAASRHTAIVRSGNFSLGVNLLISLVRQAAAALPAADFDIEVLEMHHRRKVDAPSGTALMLGAAAAEGRGMDLSENSVRVRDGITGARPGGQIGFATLRGGGVIGEHSVILAGEEEVITLSHSARDRGLFARGALAAARWVAGRKPGLYDMQDVLGG